MKNNKRIVSIALVIVLLFSGVAYASSINGLFEGFSIVNIFIDGKKIQGDVPAINFHGRTMVPVRFVSEELGANVQWDGNTASVYIDKNTNTGGNYTQEDINMMKLYTAIQAQYKSLEDLGEFLSATSDNLRTFTDGYVFSTVNRSAAIEYFDTVLSNYDERVDSYNYEVDYTEKIVEEAKLYGIDITDMYSILDSYYFALNHYDDAFDSIIYYSETNQDYHFENYLYSSGTAFETIYSGMYVAMDGYYKYLDKIVKY